MDHTEIRLSNRYYVMYGSNATVENLTWSTDRILNTCEGAFRDNVRELLSGVLSLKTGGPLVLKLALDIFIDIDDSALRSLTQNLQNLRMKDLLGENVGTIVSYLEGALLLLENFNRLSTDTVRLLNDTFYLTECDKFTNFKASNGGFDGTADRHRSRI